MQQPQNTTWYVMGPIPILYENCDELEHVPPFYFCRFPDCECHNDPELQAALRAAIDAGTLTPAQALNVYWNQER